MTDSSSELINSWLQELRSQKHFIRHDLPNYWLNDPSKLIASSTPQSLSIGTGATVLSSILPALEATEHELIFVTCFWAKSTSLILLSSTLKSLSAKALSRKDGSKIRVRICISSVSLFQKLLHTSSTSGYIYPPSQWTSKLSLPPPEELKGLDLQVKSIFILPFSVMHPKFIIADRERAWVPSCNVSWESWFEGCVVLEGPIVDMMIEFWRSFWGRNHLPALPTNTTQPDSSTSRSALSPIAAPIHNLTQGPVTTLLLPSPHHRNPQFRPFLAPPPSPPTPLNTFLLSLFASAKTSIYIQTPNLTSPPVLGALRNALVRGINVSILTNTRMMLLEQLLTAGTTTELCVKRLSKWCRLLLNSIPSARAADLESGDTGTRQEIGSLNIKYYTPNETNARRPDSEEPLKSHLKLTIVDEEIVVLGSGNMDRASWYTSQELGIAFFSKEMSKEVMQVVGKEMVGRSKPHN
ncbi:MAG: hypothetical protein M1812_003712 [Candelaria pacifica]|nr:MAG: hypothetical protein M1812_003712 [Candelaria pacifica]